jgi:hypothetical protein
MPLVHPKPVSSSRFVTSTGPDPVMEHLLPYAIKQALQEQAHVEEVAPLHHLCSLLQFPGENKSREYVHITYAFG